MQNYYKVILTLFFCYPFLAFSQIRSERDLVGKWSGKDHQVEFFADGRVLLTVPGGRLPIAKYKTDFQKNPVGLLVNLVDNGQQLTYEGTIEFIDSQTINLTYKTGNEDGFSKSRGRSTRLTKSK